MGLNEEELDRFILSEDEVRIKERVWVELNKDYLEAIAGEFYTIVVSSCVLLLYK
jgi:transcription factor IIIB subunit 2